MLSAVNRLEQEVKESRGQSLFMLEPNTWLEVAILIAILAEIALSWGWHREEMTQWRRENGDKEKEEEGN